MIRRLFSILFLALLIFVLCWNHTLENPKPVQSRYVKFDSQGTRLGNWEGPWACVLDSHTGLLWEVKTDDESIHDGYWTYSWFYENKGVKNSGDCYFENERCDTSDLIIRAIQQARCGKTSWRLPTAKELSTLVIEPTAPGSPSIAVDFFPQTKHGDYWTADSSKLLSGVYKHLKEGAIAIDFTDGTTRTIPYRNAAFVRLVSSN